ncbi:p21-activated protein kinase-interacting protein 1-like isoform X2 [Folsomia candida]|nr:p21-activated protein kinase-interacting protein 1-like isoform X2 [Folsomia candida]
MGLRVEHGYMQQQSGTITCITNFGSKYLFSGSTDGTICIWKCGSWICEKTLHAHVGGVLDVSIHPSGKLALSVGMDKTLKTWNLIKGRTGFVTNLHGVGDVVRWSPEGTYYAVGISNRLDVYNVETAKVVYSVPFGKRVSSLCFPNDDVVIMAGDKDTVEVHNITKSKKLSEFKAHKVRVKDMRFIVEHNLLVTGSNCDQYIKLWRFKDESCSTSPTLVTELDTTCRITCLTVWSKSIAKSQSDIATPEVESIDKTAKTNKNDEISDDDEKVNDEDDDEELSKLRTSKVNKTKLGKLDKKSKKNVRTLKEQGKKRKVNPSESMVPNSNKKLLGGKETKTVDVKQQSKPIAEPPKKKRKTKNSKP